MVPAHSLYLLLSYFSPNSLSCVNGSSMRTGRFKLKIVFVGCLKGTGRVYPLTPSPPPPIHTHSQDVYIHIKSRNQRFHATAQHSKVKISPCPVMSKSREWY